mmetsp:Transcript_26298/g.37460  ORF Transcript_26298/g.37460 Transcript_26298/m.37460 type:complete len:224 (+) Transcript_26298:22-693(+)
MSSALLVNAAKQAGELWDKLKLDKKSPEEITKAVVKEWGVDASKASESCFQLMLRLVLGESGDKAKFQNFVQTFGPIDKPNSDENVILERLEKEFYDQSKKDVYTWFHGDINPEQAANHVQESKEHGSYLIRMGKDPGTLTLDRLSQRGSKMMLAKSRLINTGEGWHCQEKKKDFKSIAEYQEARGPKQGDQARLIKIVDRKATGAGGAGSNFYAPCFSEEKK